MRAYIAAYVAGMVRKIVWLNESTTGIFVGIYGRNDDFHLSYHQEGRVYIKRKRKIVGGAARIPPINDIIGNRLVIRQALELSNELPQGDEFTPDGKASAAIFVGQNSFKDKESLAIDVYIVNRMAETEFVNQIYSPLETPPAYELINFSMFTLDNFSNHQVGIVLGAANIQPKVEGLPFKVLNRNVTYYPTSSS